MGVLDRVMKFDQEKTTECILYLAKRLKNPDYVQIAKLLYLADKTHLDSYARTITGDSYIAYIQGNFGAKTLDLLQIVDASDDPAFSIEYSHITPLRDPDLDYLSKSDVEALDLVMKLYGELPNWHLIQLSQDYAWLETRIKSPKQMIKGLFGYYEEVEFELIVQSVDNLDSYLMEHLMETGHQNAGND